jgi:hypothetical protein
MLSYLGTLVLGFVGTAVVYAIFPNFGKNLTEIQTKIVDLLKEKFFKK